MYVNSSKVKEEYKDMVYNKVHKAQLIVLQTCILISMFINISAIF